MAGNDLSQPSSLLRDWPMTFTQLSCTCRDGLIPLCQMEVVMDLRLGGFGDRRLEKGGPICWRDWFRMERAGSGFGVWAVIGRARSVSRDFCVTRP